MRYLLTLTALLLAVQFALGQEDKKEESKGDGFVYLKEQPKPLNMDEVKGKFIYPAKASKKGIQGRVAIRVKVGEKGQYLEHKVLSSPSRLLTQEIEKYIHLLKFSPAITTEEKHYAVWVTVPFDFKIEDDEKAED